MGIQTGFMLKKVHAAAGEGRLDAKRMADNMRRSELRQEFMKGIQPLVVSPQKSGFPFWMLLHQKPKEKQPLRFF